MIVKELIEHLQGVKSYNHVFIKNGGKLYNVGEVIKGFAYVDLKTEKISKEMLHTLEQLRQQQIGIVSGASVNLDAGNPSSYSGSGTDWFDLSGNSYDAVLTNGVGYDNANGGILTFDGGTQYVDGHDTPQINTSQPFTVEVWYNADNRDDWYHLAICETNDVQFSIFHPPTSGFSGYGTIAFGYTGSVGVRIQAKINDSLPVSNWYQIVIVYDGVSQTSLSSYKCYVNAVSKTVIQADSFGAQSNENLIGGQSSGATNLDGKIAIYNQYNNKEFSQSEIIQNFDHYKSRFGL